MSQGGFQWGPALKKITDITIDKYLMLKMSKL